MMCIMDLNHRAEQLKALADPLRLRILALLRERGESCVCEITAALGTTQGNISTHLRVLRSAGLLRSQKLGKWVFYAVDETAAGELLGWLGGALAPAAGERRPADNLYPCCPSGLVALSWGAAQRTG